MLINVIIPLRDVTVIEKAAAHNQSDSGILFTTKQKSSFLFMQVDDRDFLVSKLSELLCKTTPGRRFTYGSSCLPLFEGSFMFSFVAI